jgi:hypothetical protein
LRAGSRQFSHRGGIVPRGFRSQILVLELQSKVPRCPTKGSRHWLAAEPDPAMVLRGRQHTGHGNDQG